MRTDFINFSHFNIRSIHTGFDMFSDVVLDESFDILGLSETWLDSSFHDNGIYIPNYKLIRKDRGTRGGGIGFYLKNSFKFNVLETPAQNADENVLEDLWISLKISGKKMCFGTLYRPPNSNLGKFLEILENILVNFIPEFDVIIFGGDLNIDFSKANDKYCDAARLNNLLNKYNLHQVISEPTRVTDSTSKIIDLIVTSDLNLIANTNVINMENISDHSLVSCALKLKKEKQSPIFRAYRDFHNFNYELFLKDLNVINWAFIYALESVDDMIEFWNSSITMLFDLHAPYKTVRITKSPAPWLTENLRLMIKIKNKAFAKYKKFKTTETWNEYKNLRNLVNFSVKMEKKAYLQHKFKTDPKEFWKTLKYLNINQNVNYSSSIIGDPDTFNNFFLDSVPQTNVSVNNFILDKYKNEFLNNNAKFNFSIVSVEKVDMVIRSLKTNAQGCDKIDLKMLTLVFPHLTPFLTFIINKCLQTGTFPDEWKKANIILIPKNNHPSALAHFRPISILPTISKVLEKIVAEQLNEFLINKNILPSCQSGFRANHSTSTALLQVTDDIFRACDKGNNTCLVLLDFSKAFDTLSHAILCNKLEYYGIQGPALLFFKNYLNNRHQRVIASEDCSDFRIITQGVPQGSILGPLLFSIYTSDFWTYLEHCQIHQYADDTQIYFSFQPADAIAAADKINLDLKHIIDVSQAHNLMLNDTKTEVLLFGTHRESLINNVNFQIKLNNSSLILTTDFCKNLGIYLDVNLRFSKHVNYLVQKSYSKLKLLYMHKDDLNTDVKLRLCDSLILSHLAYCDIVYWPTLLNRDKETLQKIQNSCVRYSYGLRKFDHISETFQKTHWLKLNERYHVHMACLVHKINKNETPVYLFSKLLKGEHCNSTRFCDLYRVPKHKTALFQRSFSYNAVKVYNRIPQDIKKLLNISTFRKHVKNQIKNSS